MKNQKIHQTAFHFGGGLTPQILALVAVLTFCGYQSAQAASPFTRTWNGGVDGDFNNTGNWSSSKVPTGIDTALFGATVGASATPTLGVDTVIGDLQFSATAAAFTINGTSTLTIMNNGKVGAGAFGIQMLAGSGHDQIINAPIILGAAQTWNIQDRTLTIGGTISGAFDLTKSGAGTLTLNGNSTAYANAILVSAGTLKLGNAGALGTTAAGTTVSSGGVLDLNGQTIGAEAVQLNGTGISSGGAIINSSGSAASLGGPVTFGSATSVGGSGDITFSSGVSGAGFTKVGSGALHLNAASSYTGGTTLNQGNLWLGADNALGSGGFVFAGGILNANNHNASGIGALSLTANSTLNLSAGGAATTLTFSSASASGGALLTINNWTGTARTSGTDDRIIITANPGAAFLGQIQFAGGGWGQGALWLPGIGEIVPVPEPIHYALAVFGLVFGGLRAGRFYLARRKTNR